MIGERSKMKLRPGIIMRMRAINRFASVLLSLAIVAPILTGCHAPSSVRKKLPVTYLESVSSDGRLIATINGEESQTRTFLELRDARTLKVMNKWVVGGDTSSDTAVFSPDGDQIAILGDWDFTLLSLKTGKILRISDLNGVCEGVLFRKGGDIQILTVRGHGNDFVAKIALYDLKTHKQLWNRQFNFQVEGITVSPNNQVAAVVTDDSDFHQHVFLVDPATGSAALGGFSIPDTADSKTMCFSHDSQKLAFSPEWDKIEVWSLTTRRLIKTISCSQKGMFPVSAVAFSADDRYITFGGDEQEHTLLESLAENYHDYGIVWLWDLNTGKVRELTGFEDGVGQLSFAADNKEVVCESPSGEVVIFNTQL